MNKIYIPPKEKLYITDKYGDCSKYYYIPVIRDFYIKRIRMVIDLMPDNSTSALDIGYGSGILFYELRKKFSFLHGMDLRKDADVVKRLMRQDGITVNLINGNLNSLPYNDASFDCIIAMSVLEHIYDLEQPTREIGRVLKEDGCFICGFPTKNFYMHQFFKMIKFDDEKDHPSGHRYIYNTLKKNFKIEKMLKFPSFLNMDNCLYVACRCRKK